ncbi:phospholipid-transporting ATPase VA-like isoform X1 [Branchiostoma lanceolatum]|uniref:phospholipid-transporting ATPase VA-like isoform X1 n=1 Tax=Branchiostoma lanceolatum TaxID=7740 RepID=UPI003456426B
MGQIMGGKNGPYNHVDFGKRIVTPNLGTPEPDDRAGNPHYPDNKIQTTKYTILSFLPKNLFEQFHRLANVYFLFIVCLNFVPQVQAYGKEIAMLPVIFVLLVTAIKDMYEDYRRYRMDKEVNNRICRVYSGAEKQFKGCMWEEVRVGDVVHVGCNEMIPADLVLLKSSDKTGVCHLETANLDGETNLKTRETALPLQEAPSWEEGEHFWIECGRPSSDVYKFNGRIKHHKTVLPLSKAQLLQRGCVLRNTDFIEGIVVYAGPDTKAMLNNSGPQYKRSKLERQMNIDVAFCAVILVIMCAAGGIGNGLWINWYPQDSAQLFIPPIEGQSEGLDPALDGFIRFWMYIVIFQVIIPLSLYVSIEVIKMGQVYFIHQDIHLYDHSSDTSLQCRALNITEDLGQIQYVFTDKTGTLTENMMVFRRCAVGGKDYAHNIKVVERLRSSTSSSVFISWFPSGPFISDEMKGEEALRKSIVHIPGQTTQDFIMDHPMVPEPNSILQETVESVYTEAPPSGEQGNYSELEEFFMVLCVCNTVMVTTGHHDPQESIDQQAIGATSGARWDVSGDNIAFEPETDSTTTGNTSQTAPIQYESESPDEAALVYAAAAYGYTLLERTPRSVRIRKPDQSEITLGILNILHFDSTRKRMSVIVRYPEKNEIVLYCKGADEAIFSQLDANVQGQQEKQLTVEGHLLNYSQEGLRTLCMARKVMTEADYLTWQGEYTKAAQHLEARDEMVYMCACRLEQGLTLLGATGVEDRLQEGVPDTIAALRRAGLGVWMLTGDKQETAINIGYSCHLLQKGDNVIRFNCHDGKLIDQQLKEICLQLGACGCQQCRPQTASCMEKLHNFCCRCGHTVEASNTCLRQQRNGAVDASEVGYGASLDITKKIRRVVPAAWIGPDEDVRHMPPKQNSVKTTKSFQGNASSGDPCLVVDGRTLALLLEEQRADWLLAVARECKAVICCRATPLQKANMLKLVRDRLQVMTLAVGDGANDVSMLQAADIGVGIMGQEGMQAVMASDFSTPRFSFLRRLLLVHGHWCYYRLATVVAYFFYKNAAFVFVLFWYQLMNGFSGSAPGDQYYLLFFNILFTSAPQIVLGVLDQNLPDDALSAFPELYAVGRESRTYRREHFWWNICDALYQSAVMFFIPYGAYADSDVGIWEFGITVMGVALVVTLAHLAIQIKCWTYPHVLIFLASLLLYLIFSLVYSAACVTCNPLGNPYWLFQHTISTPEHWGLLILTTVIALFPRFLFQYVQSVLFPTRVDRARLFTTRPYGDERSSTSTATSFVIS